MSGNINWFPGHMKKALDAIRSHLKQVDVIIETADSRIPDSSRNPVLLDVIGDKPSLLLLSKADLADPGVTELWIEKLRAEGTRTVAVDARNRRDLRVVEEAIEELAAPALARADRKGMPGRVPRVMVTGIPNTGKSSLINALAKRHAMTTSDRPGVTRGATWVRNRDTRIEWLDTPGVLWPKLETQREQVNLGATGAIRDQVLPLEDVAYFLLIYLLEHYPEETISRFKLKHPEEEAYEVFIEAARNRGCILSGGRVDQLRFSALLLDEYRAGTIGRISLERPDEVEDGVN